MKTIIFVCFILFVTGHPLQTGSCSNPRSYAKPFPQINTNDPIIQSAIQQVQQVLAYSVNQTQMAQSAMSLAIVFNQTLLWSGGVGTMDATNPNSPAPDGDTIYKIASQTKVFTTFMLLQLRDMGLLSLDDGAMDTFPNLILRSDPFGTNKRITLRNLASQLSGLPRESPCGLGNTPLPGCTVFSDVWSLISQIVDPIWPPGQLPSYSNLGFSILGRGLAEIVGVSYEKWVVDNILTPLGMTSSGFNITQAVAERMPTIYGIPHNTTWPKITDLGWSNPAGQMYSTVNDIAKFMMNLFHDSDESVFNRNSVRESFTPQWNDFSGTSGFGMPYEMFYYDNLWLMTKGGDLPGFDSLSCYVQEYKLGVSFLTSMGGGILPPIDSVVFPAVSIMVNAIKTVIANQQATMVYPPPAELIPAVLGCYSQTVLNIPMVYNINQNSTTGELSIESPVGLITAPLHYRDRTNIGYEFQIGVMNTDSICLEAELTAAEGQYLVFQPKGDSYVIYFPTLIGMDLYLPKCQ